MKTPLLQLQVLLKHKENNPFDVIKINTGEKSSFGPNKGKARYCDVRHFVNIYYCCHTGDDERRGGSLKDNEKKLLATIKQKEAVLIMVKYNTFEKFKRAFDREMHWINQTRRRQDNFIYISKKMFDHIERVVVKAGGIDSYVKKHFDSLAKMLPIKKHHIYLEGLNLTQILEAVAEKKVTAKEAEPLIRKLEHEENERNSDKLCPFSGSGRNPEQAGSICSRTGDPKRLGDCSTCRVASDWEEAYG